MKILKILAITASVTLPVTATAQETGDYLEARHGYMKMLGLNMGVLSGMAKGDIAYDENAASAAAANILALSSYNPVPLFVPGTSSDDIDGSEALPAIWDKPDDFAAKFVAMNEAATGAPDAVKGGQGNIGPVLQKLGGSCKSCHDDFRKPD